MPPKKHSLCPLLTLASIVPILYEFSTVPSLYPVIPLIAIIGGLFVIINQLLTATLIAVGGIVITLIGWPVYEVTSKRKLDE